MRVIPEVEAQTLRQSIKSKWGWNSTYWYPLTKILRTDILALVASKFNEILGENQIIEVLKRINAKSIYNLRELGPSEELDIGEISYIYESESILFDSTSSWIIYISHEDSITFGGNMLIAEVVRLCPGWKMLAW